VRNGPGSMATDLIPNGANSWVMAYGAEKDRLWAIADAGNPVYADYRARAGRDIPILVLDRIGMRDRGNADSHHRQEFGL